MFLYDFAQLKNSLISQRRCPSPQKFAAQRDGLAHFEILDTWVFIEFYLPFIGERLPSIDSRNKSGKHKDSALFVAAAVIEVCLQSHKQTIPALIGGKSTHERVDVVGRGRFQGGHESALPARGGAYTTPAAGYVKCIVAPPSIRRRSANTPTANPPCSASRRSSNTTCASC